jgi:hypothetical protein
VTCVAEVTTDFNSVARPQGASCDPGAFEYASGASNQPPTSTIDTPTGDTTINAGGAVSFTGTGSDPDGNTPLTYAWSFGEGGPTASTSEDPGSTTFPTAGEYVVTFTVTDALALADATPATVTIHVGSAATGCGSGADTFTGTGTLGSTWTRMNDTTGATAERVENRAQASTTLADVLYLCNAISPTNDQTAALVLGPTSPGSLYQGAGVRMAGTTSTTFDGYVCYATATEWLITEFADGVPTDLARGFRTHAEGDAVTCSVVGSTVTMRREGVILGLAVDTTLTSGKTGLALYGAGASISSWSSTDESAPAATASGRGRIKGVR